MSEEGFVKISRKMLSWGWFKDVNTAHLFMYCLMRANYKDAEWKGVKLKRGSFLTSLKHLSEETGLTLQQTRTSLQHLISTKEITKQSSSKNTVIIVNNYEKYQDVNITPHTRSTSRKHNTGSKVTKYQHSGNTSVTTDKKKKKYIPPIREEYTAASPERLDGVGLASVKEKKAVVSVAEMRTFGDTVPGSNDYLACGFRRGFVNSGTRMPDDWQDIYRCFVRAERKQQNEFLDLLESGAYREKWGTID